MRDVTISIDSRCEICDRKISVVAAWLPYGAGIRHVSCEPRCAKCDGPFRHPDEIVEDEAGHWLHEDCEEAYFGDELADGEVPF